MASPRGKRSMNWFATSFSLPRIRTRSPERRESFKFWVGGPPTRRLRSDHVETNERDEAATLATLWECPRCGAKLIAKNLSHSCGAYSMEKFLEGKSDIGCDFFNRFVTLIAKCGPYEVAPAKTRVAFMAAVRFASVNWVGRDFIDGISSFRGRSTAPDSAKSNTWASCMCTT